MTEVTDNPGILAQHEVRTELNGSHSTQSRTGMELAVLPSVDDLRAAVQQVLQY